MNEQEPSAPEPDADLAGLLRRAGARSQPDPGRTDEIRAQVEREWRAVVAARRSRGRRRTWLAAAGVAFVAVAVWTARPWLAGPAAPVASLTRATGTVEVRHDGDDAWRALAPAEAIVGGDRLRTANASGAALRRADGLEVRLAAATELEWQAETVAQLARGSVYVDAGAVGTRAPAPFELHTALGVVRHLGTQYLAALTGDTLRVRVREGAVAVTGDAAPVVARTGESLSIAADGRVTRNEIETHGEAWRWAESLAPEFAIDGRSLDAFLVWAARETGRRVVYQSPAAAHEAEATVLKGAVSGLAPDDAVNAVFATVPTLHHDLAGGQIRVRAAGAT